MAASAELARVARLRVGDRESFRVTAPAAAAEFPRLRLYDVHVDPNERNSVSDADPATTERMRSLLRGIETESRSLAFALERASEDDGDDQALRELGYLGGE
ncbi:MAG: hypothetical protein IPH13_01800 [Planctomycetes bacterium]|nr:hypothetical protein [Planctomycetota bacterium]MCC7169295.1 hypothetical protein [Planctomycetota bacterium]